MGEVSRQAEVTFVTTGCNFEGERQLKIGAPHQTFKEVLVKEVIQHVT